MKKGGAMAKPEVVIFDFDDTLLKSSESFYLLTQRISKEFGLPIPSKREIISQWGKPLSEIALALHPGLDVSLYSEKIQEYEKEIFESGDISFFGDVEKALKLLAAREMRLAVLSSRLRVNAEIYFKKTGLFGYFEYLHFLEESSYRKPDFRVFDNIKTHFNVNPHKIVYVGDALTDFIAADDAGLQFIAVITGVASERHFKICGCKNIINSLAELPIFIEKISKG